MRESEKPNYLPAVLIRVVFEAIAVALWLGLGNPLYLFSSLRHL